MNTTGRSYRSNAVKGEKEYRDEIILVWHEISFMAVYYNTNWAQLLRKYESELYDLLVCQDKHTLSHLNLVPRLFLFSGESLVTRLVPPIYIAVF